MAPSRHSGWPIGCNPAPSWPLATDISGAARWPSHRDRFTYSPGRAHSGPYVAGPGRRQEKPSSPWHSPWLERYWLHPVPGSDHPEGIVPPGNLGRRPTPDQRASMARTRLRSSDANRPEQRHAARRPAQHRTGCAFRWRDHRAPAVGGDLRTGLRLLLENRKSPAVLLASTWLVFGLAAGLTEGNAFLPRPKEHWFLIWIPMALLYALWIQQSSPPAGAVRISPRLECGDISDQEKTAAQCRGRSSRSSTSAASRRAAPGPVPCPGSST